MLFYGVGDERDGKIQKRLLMPKHVVSMNKKITHFLFFPLLVLSACASKNDLIVVADDLRKLKTDSETIKTQSAGSYSEVQALRDEVAGFKGSIAELSHSSNKSFSRLGAEDSLMVHKIDDLETRLQKIEQYLGLGAQENSATAQPSSQEKDAAEGVKASGGRNDVALLNDGLEKLGKKNYVAARKSFGDLLKSYPKSTLAGDAQFQLAESYFIEKWYEKAITEYQVVISKYTKSSKRPAALFKQARSFELIGDAASAKTRYKDLVNVYPASPEAALAIKKIQ